MSASRELNGHRVHTLETFLPIAEKLKSEGKRLVQCDGVFDLVHAGHLEYFAQAKKQGDVLYVVLVTDRYVKKGPNRPIFDHDTRALWVASLAPVDYAIVNDAEGPQNILEAVQPNVLVKGAEYITKPTEGFLKNKAYVESYGGRAAFVEELAHSSEILQRIYKMFT